MNRDHSSSKAMPRPGGFPLPLSAFCTGSGKVQEGNSSSALPASAAFPWDSIQRGHSSSGHSDCRGYLLQSSRLIWHGLLQVSKHALPPRSLLARSSSMEGNLQAWRLWLPKAWPQSYVCSRSTRVNSGKTWQQVRQLWTMPAGERSEWPCSGPSPTAVPAS